MDHIEQTQDNALNRNKYPISSIISVHIPENELFDTKWNIPSHNIHVTVFNVANSRYLINRHWVLFLLPTITELNSRATKITDTTNTAISDNIDGIDVRLVHIICVRHNAVIEMANFHSGYWFRRMLSLETKLRINITEDTISNAGEEVLSLAFTLSIQQMPWIISILDDRILPRNMMHSMEYKLTKIVQW